MILLWHFLTWCLHVGGIDDVSGPWYAFWSGFGSDIGELLLIGGAFKLYQHHTCHVDGCWRLGKHKHAVAGAEYVLCRKHHPNVPDKITADHVGGRS